MLRLAPNLDLPLDAVTQRFAFLGRIGSGKTYAGTKLLELMLEAGAQVIALDPVGKCYGLRVAGKGAAFDIPIFGGLHGDVPLEPTGGALIADLIVDRSLSCVIDVSQFASDADKARFASAFAERFFARKKAQPAPAPVFIFLEECQEFVPQNTARGEEMMLHHWTRMAKLGRNFGIGLGLASQRPQEVNKKVLNLTEVLFAFQLRGSHERKAVREWITAKDADESILDQLPKLPEGVAIVDSPQWLNVSERVKVYEKRTADVSATPKLGDRSFAAERRLSAVDIAQLRDQMADTIAKAKAEDPRELRKEIAALKKQLATAPTAEKIVERVVVDERAIARAVSAAIKPYNDAGIRITSMVSRLVDRTQAFGIEILSDLQKLDAPWVGVAAPAPTAPPTAIRSARPVSRARATDHPSPAEGDLSRGQQRILNALAELELLGVDSPSRYQLGMVAGYNLTGGSGAQHVADLGKLGLLDVGDGTVSITDAGRSAASTDAVPSTLTELHERVLRKLSSGQRKIAEHLISIYPESISRADLGAATGYNLTGGSGAQHVADLVTVGAAEIPRKGDVRASSLLFPEGLC